jgi:hypothetical protein
VIFTVSAMRTHICLQTEICAQFLTTYVRTPNHFQQDAEQSTATFWCGDEEPSYTLTSYKINLTKHCSPVVSAHA